jgi:hypothetical protein
LPGRQPQPSRHAVQDALLALPPNTPLAAIQGFWRAYLEDGGLPAGRVSAMQSGLSAIRRALGHCHDDEAAHLIDWKFSRDRKPLSCRSTPIPHQGRTSVIRQPRIKPMTKLSTPAEIRQRLLCDGASPPVPGFGLWVGSWPPPAWGSLS